MSISNADEKQLNIVTLKSFQSERGKTYPTFHLSFQLFGKRLHIAPVVLVNHALTGNSTVIGKTGWFNGLCGPGKLIDTNKVTVLAIDIPGNGYNQTPQSLLEDYQDFTARDVAKLYGLVCQQLNISKLHAAIGGSLGGAIAWEMAILFPDLIEHLIPIACDWRSTDWIIANNRVQMQILNNSKQPLHDVRMFSMLFFRTARSFQEKFNKSINSELGIYNVESWLLHHGEKITGRFHPTSYKTMLHLLNSVDITRGRGSFENVIATTQSKIHLMGIENDLLFPPETILASLQKIKKAGVQAEYLEIKTMHGHDAFLIEFEQMTRLLCPVFENL